MKLNTIKDKFNGIKVTNRSTEPFNYRIYTRPQTYNQSYNQDDQSFISI